MATTGLRFDDALDALVTGGSYEAALAFSGFVPFLAAVPKQVACRLIVDLQGINGWEALKGTGLELVVLEGTRDGLLEPRVWRALSWAAFSGVNEGVRQTKPFKVEGVPLDPTWPVDFKNELSLALFGLATPQQAEEEPTAVKVVEVFVFQRLHCLRQRQDKVEPKVEAQVPGAQVEVRNPDEHDDDAASEASWLREQLTPTPAVMKVGEEDESSQEEDAQSNASWFEAPFVDDLPPPEAEGAMVADDEPEVEGG
ncbi:unnamed protein product, partial [Symbiodinium microadriaticum]